MKKLILFLVSFYFIQGFAQSVSGATMVCTTDMNPTYSLTGWSCNSNNNCNFTMKVFFLPTGLPEILVETINNTQFASIDWGAKFAQNGNATDLQKTFKVQVEIKGCDEIICNKKVSTTVKVNKAIGSIGLINGATNQVVNCGSTNPVTFSISPVAFATGYIWTVPSGWVINSGLNTPSITVTPTATGGHNANVCVTANGMGTCSGGSANNNSKCIKIDRQVPAKPIITVPSGNFCANQTKTISVPGVNLANVTYTWEIANTPVQSSGVFFPANNGTAIITTTPSVVVKAPSSGGGVSGVKVRINIPCGSSPWSNFTSLDYGTPPIPSNIVVNLCQTPSQATAYASGGGSTASWAWSVSGANNLTYSGNDAEFEVDFANHPQGWLINLTASRNNACGAGPALTIAQSCNCCGSGGGGVLYRTSHNNLPISIQPNPVSNNLTILGNTNIIHNVQILNMNGQSVYEQTINEEKADIELNVSQLPQGIYILKVDTENGQEVKKFVKE